MVLTFKKFFFQRAIAEERHKSMSLAALLFSEQTPLETETE